MVFPSINIAITGSTKLSELLAFTLAGLGHRVSFGVKEEERKKYPLVAMHSNVSLESIEDAAEKSEVILIASRPSDVREMAYYIDDVKGRVVIDMSSFLASASENQVNTLNAIKTITGSEQVVKCYGALKNYEFANHFSRNNVQEIFIAGDNKKSKMIAEFIFRDMGIILCHDIGNDDIAKLLDTVMVNDLNNNKLIK